MSVVSHLSKPNEGTTLHMDKIMDKYKSLGMMIKIFLSMSSKSKFKHVKIRNMNTP